MRRLRKSIETNTNFCFAVELEIYIGFISACCWSCAWDIQLSSINPQCNEIVADALTYYFSLRENGSSLFMKNGGFKLVLPRDLCDYNLPVCK